MHEKMPVVFVGHGSPMNVIEQNRYTESLLNLGKALPAPAAILVVSAHWLTKETRVTAAALPRQIYDFHGFPRELYEVEYLRPGSPGLAQRIVEALDGKAVLDEARGIDHAAWAPLCRMGLAADVPVLELSIDPSKPPEYHYQLAGKLAPLRKEGVLIVGSGNVVHNLAAADFDNMDAPAFDWAIGADAEIAGHLEQRNDDRLIHYLKEPWGQQAAPTNDHFLPVLYVIGMADAKEALCFYHRGLQNRSVSMMGFLFG